MWGKFLAGFLVVFFMNACAPGGIIDSTIDVCSGKAEDAIKKRKDELAQEKKEYEITKKKNEQLENDLKERRQVLATAKNRVDKMEMELLSLEANVDKLKAKSNRKQNEIALLKNKIEAYRNLLEAHRGSIIKLNDTNSDSEHYNALIKERDRLRKEYDALLAYYIAISKSVN